MNDNITPIECKPNEMAKAVGLMKENLPHILEYIAIGAQLSYTKFTALKEEGFTDEQAIELCKKLF
jgi:hypothetical protein